MFRECKGKDQELKSFESGVYRIKVGEWAFQNDRKESKESVGHISKITKDSYGRIFVHVDVVLDFEKGSESYSKYIKRRPNNEIWYANDVWRVDNYDKKMLEKDGVRLRLHSLF